MKNFFKLKKSAPDSKDIGNLEKLKLNLEKMEWAKAKVMYLDTAYLLTTTK